MHQLLIEAQSAISHAMCELRRAAAAVSPEAFVRIYLSNYCRLPFSRMHKELLALLLTMSTARCAREVVAAPRGHAKTTLIGTAYVLWSALYQKEPFILMVTSTQDLAKALLKSVRDELRTNPLLATDFPEVCGPPAPPPTRERWQAQQIVLRNGNTIHSLGAGQSIRGRKHGPNRPTLIIVDDLESQESVANEEQRDKTVEWFEKTLVPAGGPTTNIVLIGTVLHHDSLLARKIKSPGWHGQRYQAVENWSDNPALWDRWESIYRGQENHEGREGAEAAKAYFQQNRAAMLAGTKVLWPELEDYYKLMEMRLSGGISSFQSEKQNDPVNPEECVFREELIQFWDRDYANSQDLIRAIGSKGYIFGACDPSLGASGVGRGDFTAVVTVLKDKQTNRYYVLDADLARRPPEKTVAKIVELAGVYNYRAFAFEANQFQSVLAKDLQRRTGQKGLRMKVEEVTSRTNKHARIASLETLVSQGLLLFSRRQQLLLEQLRLFPQATHDDGPDALEMAVALAQNYQHHVWRSWPA